MLTFFFLFLGLLAGAGMIWGGLKIIEWQRQADVEERELHASGLDRSIRDRNNSTIGIGSGAAD